MINTDSIVKETKDALSAIMENDYSEIEEVQKTWFYLQFLLVTLLNYHRLFNYSSWNSNHSIALCKMHGYGLVGDKLLEFYKTQTRHLTAYLDRISFGSPVTDFIQSIQAIREHFMKVELRIRLDKIDVIESRATTNITDSFYTPPELAKTVVREAIEQLINKKYEKMPIDSNLTSRQRIRDFLQSATIVDLSCGCGDFFWAAQEYLLNSYDIPYEKSAKSFYGIDIDPIALQIVICRIIAQVEEKEWRKIIKQFSLGNALYYSHTPISIDEKADLFATGRLYAKEMGVDYTIVFGGTTPDIIIGNPPWGKIRFEERKFFKPARPDISSVPQKNKRAVLVESIKDTWPQLFDLYCKVSADFQSARKYLVLNPFLKKSIAGELNTNTLFCELAYNMANRHGCSAMVLKSSIAIAQANKAFWNHLIDTNAISTILFFDNREKIFNIDSRERFCILVLTRTKREGFELVAGLTNTSGIFQKERTTITKDQLVRINPFSGMMPNISSNDSMRVLLDIHKRLPLFDDIYPNCHFGRLIHLTAHSKYIDTSSKKDNILVYEGKFIEQYDARYSTFEEVPTDKVYAPKASSVRQKECVDKKIPEGRYFVNAEFWNSYRVNYSELYSLCWRSLTSVTNRRTMIAMILPNCPTSQSIQMLQIQNKETLLLLLGLFNSIPFDYIIRLKMPGIDLTQAVIKQIPVPPPEVYEEMVTYDGIHEKLLWHILHRVLSLISNEPKLGELIKPLTEYNFRELSLSERIVNRKALDNLFSIAYGLSRQEYEEISATFPSPDYQYL